MTKDGGEREALARAVKAVRGRSMTLAAPLSAEDACAQAMPDASPTKWHLAHTTWFWTTFILEPAGVETHPPEAARYLFNSYYEAVGARYARPARGLITRPTLQEVLDWRRRVDHALERFCAAANDEAFAEARPLITLGIAHEEQHQELMLTDILALFAAHPSCPAYRPAELEGEHRAAGASWTSHEGGLAEIGHGTGGFAFDCEGPRHKVWLEPFSMADRFVTNGEWRAFMEDGGYRKPALWLSDGWDCVQREDWSAPGYWIFEDGAWTQATLHGRRALHPDAPVSHVSYWEADAFARWAGARLPREGEWETLAAGHSVQGRFQSTLLCPAPEDHQHAFGSVWVWTQSPFTPYPGFKPVEGAVGEYNGKFMAGQYVLRGGSCVTPPNHLRPTYRNFFQPDKRWQFSGLRLAKDLS